MNIDKDELYSFLRDEILEYYRHIYVFKKRKLKVHKKGRGIILPNYVAGLLFVFAKKKQLFPLPEYIPFDDSKQRIDMLWTNKEGIQIAAFEIDQTIYPKSISKLSRLDPDCRKFIISVGSGKYPLPDNLLQDTGIEFFNLTQASLGIAQ
jgi:hypothetical protein